MLTDKPEPMKNAKELIIDLRWTLARWLSPTQSSVQRDFRKLTERAAIVDQLWDLFSDHNIRLGRSTDILTHVTRMLEERARIVHHKDVQRISDHELRHHTIRKKEIVAHIKRGFAMRLAQAIMEQEAFTMTEHHEAKGLDRYHVLTFYCDTIRPLKS